MAALRSDTTPRRILVKVADHTPMRDRPGRDFGARPNAELVSNALDVALCGPLGDEQAVGDLPVGPAGRDHRDDLAFPFAQGTPSRRRLCLRLAFAKRVLQRARRAPPPAIVPGAAPLAVSN